MEINVFIELNALPSGLQLLNYRRITFSKERPGDIRGGTVIAGELGDGPHEDVVPTAVPENDEEGGFQPPTQRSFKGRSLF